MREVMINTSHNRDETITEYKPLIHAMPTENLHLLLYVLDLLALFAHKAAKNMMKTDELAKIFRHALFRHPSSVTPQHELDELVVQLLIEKQDRFILPTSGTYVQPLEDD
ncbi:hypothetical protein FB45DRAFT_948217 [Roridomyces roridus]|uniref:Rho-GAP domain-containing protein n=1 Tax=Roridomyces roridus TaxID=1738132 RepID=A0AAD7B1F5_9AGAR|nr:hypothetical protein FB45DRAFT_948217 [Roridomyces roridus]